MDVACSSRNVTCFPIAPLVTHALQTLSGFNLKEVPSGQKKIHQHIFLSRAALCQNTADLNCSQRL